MALAHPWLRSDAWASLASVPLARLVPLATVLAGLAAACAEPGGPFGTSRPRHGTDELWVNNAAEPAWIDPGRCIDSVGGEVILNIFAGLTQPHPETLVPMPDVAERWEVSPDGRRYVFHLRPSTWSDGTPLGARDFEWSWKRVLDPATAARSASFFYVLAGGEAFHQGALVVRGLAGAPALEAVRTAFAGIDASARVQAASEPGALFVFLPEPARPRGLALDGTSLGGVALSVRPADASLVGVRAADDATLEVELARPAPYFLQLLYHYTAMPVPKHVLAALAARGEDEGRWTLPAHIVSNGAFVLAEWRFRRYLLLARNERYWDAAHVRLARVRLSEVERYATALDLYKAGYLDWIGTNTTLPAELIGALAAHEDFRSSPFLTIYWYWLNTRRPPLDDVRVRRALSLAVDRQAIVTRIKRGGELATADIVPEGVAGYHGPHSAIFDPDSARRLLAEAGFPGGRGWPRVTLAVSRGENHRLIAEAVQAMWRRELGIEVAIETREWRVLLDDLANGRFDIARLGWAGDYPDPMAFLEVLASQSGNNFSGWRDEVYDALLGQAAQTGDSASRLALLRGAEALAASAQPLLPLYVMVRHQLAKPYVHGLWPNHLDRHPYKWMWIETSPEAGAE